MSLPRRRQAIIARRQKRRPRPSLRSRSCIIDGEAVACDDNGVASFDLIRHQRANERIFLYAFDLIELNGDDLRREPLEVRKATLRSALAKASPGIRFNGPLHRWSTDLEHSPLRGRYAPQGRLINPKGGKR